MGNSNIASWFRTHHESPPVVLKLETLLFGRTPNNVGDWAFSFFGVGNSASALLFAGPWRPRRDETFMDPLVSNFWDTVILSAYTDFDSYLLRTNPKLEFPFTCRLANWNWWMRWSSRTEALIYSRIEGYFCSLIVRKASSKITRFSNPISLLPNMNNQNDRRAVVTSPVQTFW